MADIPIGVQPNSISLPHDVAGNGIQLVEDVIPPKYDQGGATLLMQRPGDLGILFTIQIAFGAMIAVIPVQMAANIRGQLAAMIEQNRRHMEKLAREKGVHRDGLGH